MKLLITFDEFNLLTLGLINFKLFLIYVMIILIILN
jgi:hypothetical protein